MKPLEFTVDLNVIDHLGIGLYSKTPAVMTEVIANAWDADATHVWITLNPKKDLIIVEDNGHGMTRAEVQEKFLNVGYRRRDTAGPLSKKLKRRVMGRKGIGKLAMFSLAENIEIVTKAKSANGVAFSISVPDLKARIAAKQSYRLKSPATFKPIRSKHGTRISLHKLNNRINKTEEYLIPRLARRFAILGDIYDFRLNVNERELSRADRGFYGDVQFFWYFDDKTLKETKPLLTALASVEEKRGSKTNTVVCQEKLPAHIRAGKRSLSVTGYIATVDKPAKLGKGDESINMISVFANGRVFAEDVLPDLGSARVFNNYIVGEIHADFLDRDDVDRATASREAIKHDDEHYQLLRAHLRQCLAAIRDKWDKWRQALGYEKTTDAIPEISGWIESFASDRDKKLANRLMTSISNLAIANDPETERAAKSQLYKSTIVAFEKLRLRNKLELLEGISDVLSPEFQSIFTTIDDVEESSFFEITRSRLEVIRKFDHEIVSPKKLEKVAERYLFEHLWLLDPSWDRVSGSPQMEKVLTAELKRACPESKGGARLDIAYRTSAGRHVIVELKRPGLVNLSFPVLLEQGRRYRQATEQYLKEHPDMFRLRGRQPAIDTYLLVEKPPHMDRSDEQTLVAQSMQIVTYRGLIENAKAAYGEYLVGREALGRLEKLLVALK